MRTLLVDGDILSYRVGFACEHKMYYAVIDDEEMVFTSKTELNKFLKDNDCEEVEWQSELKVEPVNFALQTVKNSLHRAMENTKADVAEIYLTGNGNFRDEIATIMKYKGNRDDKRRPLLHKDIVDYLLVTHGAVLIDGMEADDILATRQLSAADAGEETIIASDDKDLLQVPGKHYNIRTEEKILVSPDTARLKKYVQVLVGDPTDNIPGIPGYGPPTAEKALADVDPSQYRNAVETLWHHNLTNPTERWGLPPWFVEYDPDSTRLSYKDYKGEQQITTLTGLVDEIEALITVGVPNGKKD